MAVTVCAFFFRRCTVRRVKTKKIAAICVPVAGTVSVVITILKPNNVCFGRALKTRKSC